MGKKRGRPKKDDDDKLSATFMLRLLPAEKAVYTAKAKAAGVTLTTWIRGHLNRAKR